MHETKIIYLGCISFCFAFWFKWAGISFKKKRSTGYLRIAEKFMYISHTFFQKNTIGNFVVLIPLI